MKQTIKFLFVAFFLIFFTSTSVLSEDNDIFGQTCTLVEPNILIIFDSSGSMGWAAGSTGFTRIEIAQPAIENVIDAYAENNRFGIMRFNNNATIGYHGGYILAECEEKDNYDVTTLAGLTAYKDMLKAAVNSITPSGNTPLAETLFEAGRYFAGEDSRFNGGTYDDPILLRCRKNYIILMTDGEPTADGDELEGDLINGFAPTTPNTYPYWDADDPGLPDIAALLFENDISSHLPSGTETTFITQNVLTYPIGFGDSLNATARAMLQDTADQGQGELAGEGTLGDASSALALEDVFHSIMAEITEKKTTFASPIVPIADSSQAYAGDYVYLSMFKPDDENNAWVGNLKKYKLNDENQFVSEHNDVPILDNDGYVIETARSSWSSADDGPYVAQGGMGEKLLDNGARNIIYDDASGTNGFKEFNTTNLTIGDFDFITTAAGLTAHVDEIRMTAETSANDGWKLYDLNHSKPAMASYGTDKYLFVGSNGGMLHCVDDSDGEEVWAFIPSAQFDRSDEVYETGNHYHFMDGSPTVADVDPDINNLPDLVICGERRGGNNYYAIDITSIAAPKFEYTYTVSGQSWKKPDFIEYKESAGSAPTKSFLLTGGYDLRYDNSDDLLAEVSAINTDADATNDVAEVAGGEVVIINADGTHIATFDNTDSGLSDMGASIVSAWGVDLVEDDNGAITQIYAADLEGHIFGLKDSDLDGSWQGNHLFEVTGALVGKKIFSEVDFVREFMHVYNNVTDSWDQVVGDFVYFGTGDRADPLDNQGNDKTNYFYCVKNDWTTTDITTAGTVGSFGTLDEDEAGTSTDLVMVDVSDMNISEGDTVPDSLKASYNRGWYFELEDAGEKCLSTPLVYAGVVYFATYTPPADMGGVVDPCGTSMVGGTARIYAVDYKTGGAIYNFNLTDPNLTKEDRSTTIDAKNITIAPDPVLIITDSGDKLFIGPQEINIKSPNNGVNSFYWLPL